MSILKHLNTFESDIYDNTNECLEALNRIDVDWQKAVSGERFHIKKTWGKFSFDEFAKIVRDIETMIGGKCGYEGINLSKQTGAHTTWACESHARRNHLERSIMAHDFGKLYETQVRIDTKDEKPYHYIWISAIDYGKRIKFSWALPRPKANLIIAKYFKKQDGYTLGDGFT